MFESGVSQRDCTGIDSSDTFYIDVVTGEAGLRDVEKRKLFCVSQGLPSPFSACSLGIVTGNFPLSDWKLCFYGRSVCSGGIDLVPKVEKVDVVEEKEIGTETQKVCCLPVDSQSVNAIRLTQLQKFH